MNRVFRLLSAALLVTAIMTVFSEPVFAFDAQQVAALEAMNMVPEVPLPDPVNVAAAQAAANQMTYVDVNVASQTLTYFVNGVPALSTPCVTGSPGRGTPRGVFAINSCIPGKRLVGPTWNVWVNRWMRFAGNCGIHDATWRKSFGGEIYKHNGSHGCVNIPYDQAVALYNMVGVGTVVIVH